MSLLPHFSDARAYTAVPSSLNNVFALIDQQYRHIFACPVETLRPSALSLAPCDAYESALGTPLHSGNALQMED